MSEEVQVILCEGDGYLPKYASEGAAGLDLCSQWDYVINPGQIQKVRTGIKIKMPLYMEAQIRPRSGLATKNKIVPINSPGTIDPDYEGEIIVALYNGSDEPFRVWKGMRIAQMVFAPIFRPQLKVVEKFSGEGSGRGKGGFGSTGVNWF